MSGKNEYISMSLIGSRSTAVGYKYLTCSVSDYDPFIRGIPTSCNSGHDQNFVFRLPDDLNSKIQHLNIFVNSPGSFEIDSHETFLKFSQLKTLHIRATIWLFTPRTVKAWNILRNELFASLWRLEELYLHNGGFNSQQHSWRFPSSLKTLWLYQNNYTELDLSCCPNLEYLDLNNNSLIKFPVFSECPPPLKEFFLKGNPLLEFSVNDIAKFCRTKLILLEYLSMGSYHRRCECRRLHNWAVIANYPFNLTCNLNDTSSKNCTEYTLDEAMKIRNFCLHGWEAIPTCNCSTNCKPCPVQKNNTNICDNESQNGYFYILIVVVLLFLAVSIGIGYYKFF